MGFFKYTLRVPCLFGILEFGSFSLGVVRACEARRLPLEVVRGEKNGKVGGTRILLDYFGEGTIGNY